MNIVQVGVYPISPDCIRGGVEASVYGLSLSLLNSLSSDGKEGLHRVDVFDMPRLGNGDRVEVIGDRLRVHRYANPGKHNEDALQRVDEMVQDIIAIHPDVVHVHGTGPVSSAIYRAIKQQDIPVMLTIHGLLRVEKKNKLHQAWQNLHTGTDRLAALCKKRIPALVKAFYQYIRQSRVECNLLEYADRAIVDTGYLLDALKEYPVKNLPELYVIPQGANERFYEQEKRETGSEKRELRTEKRILCVGAFGVRKSQIELVRAFELLRSHCVEAKLVLCGVVAEQAYFNSLKSVVADSTYKDDIEIKENLPFEQLMEEYRNATIFALHSQEESQGIVLAEAMAMGLPIVSTRVGGIPYVVEDGVSGILTEYGDVVATTEALGKLLTDNELREKMSIAAQQSAEKYRWENIAREIVNLYKREC